MIYLVRHGIAGPASATVSDANRSLTVEGARKMTRVVGCSAANPLPRAEESAAVLARVLAPQIEVKIYPPLTPEPEPALLLRCRSRPSDDPGSRRHERHARVTLQEGDPIRADDVTARWTLAAVLVARTGARLSAPSPPCIGRSLVLTLIAYVGPHTGREGMVASPAADLKLAT